MSTENGKRKKKTQAETIVLSWQEKKIIADEEEQTLGKQIEELKTWTCMIENMDDQQLKDYVRNRPDHLKTVKTEIAKPRKTVQKTAKDRSSESCRIMASVWKFHKEDDEGPSANSNAYK